MNTPHFSRRRFLQSTALGALGFPAILRSQSPGSKLNIVALCDVNAKNLDAAALDLRVRKYVLKGAEIHTDENQACRKLQDEYTHKVVSHAECYVKDGVHTNGLENFWSPLARRSLRNRRCRNWNGWRSQPCTWEAGIWPGMAARGAGRTSPSGS